MTDPRTFRIEEQLSNGEIVTIRAVRSDDRGSVIEVLRSLSPSSLYFRFFSEKRTFTEKEISYMIDVNFVTHVAIVAVIREGEKERFVGGARYVRLGDPAESHSAEVSFLIEDSHQGIGLGSLLFRHIAALARDAGITRFEAEVLTTNYLMLGVFQHCGLPVRMTPDFDTVHVSVELVSGGRS